MINHRILSNKLPYFTEGKNCCGNILNFILLKYNPVALHMAYLLYCCGLYTDDFAQLLAAYLSPSWLELGQF